MRSRKEELAELVGITLGDGSLYVNKKHKIYQFVITGHIKNDKEYFERFIFPLLERRFGKNFKWKFDIKTNGIRIRSQKRSIVKMISKLGIPIGNKLKNNVRIPDWIFGDKNLIRACIRGLIDTDGFVTPITGRNYSYIWFSSQIPALQESFSKAMEILEFKTSKWRQGVNTASQIFVGAKPMIVKYFSEINFNNPYHKNRFKLPSSSPVK
ncbi:MAG: hypothetical protein HY361_05350 [Candidatus Aenigmarchaeota archaeon]|nr:hypothetical protein [Candidatus Aenigmarchaeota archaeon]